MPEQKLDVKISTTADVSGANQATKALDGVAQAGAKAGKGSVTFLNSTAQAAGNASKSVDALKKSGDALGKIFNGVAAANSGDLVQRFIGLKTAASGAADLLRSLVTSGAVRAAAAFGGLAAAVAVVGKVFLDTRKAITDANDGVNLASKSAEEYQKELVEIGKTSSVALEKHLADIKKVSDAYTELLGRMDEAERRASKRGELSTTLALTKADLDEKKALALAKTDAERAKISERFDKERTGIKEVAENAGLENKVLASKVRNDNATTAISEANGSVRAATVDAAVATRARELADDNAAAALEGIQGAKTPLEKRRAAIAATDALRSRGVAQAAETAALNNVKTVTIEAEKVISPATEEITSAQNTIEDTQTEKKIVNTKRSADSITIAPISTLSEPTTERTDALEQRLKSLSDSQLKSRKFGGDAGTAREIETATAALAQSKEDDSKALSIFTAQVQATAASRKKMVREMEKVSTRANDNR